MYDVAWKMSVRKTIVIVISIILITLVYLWRDNSAFSFHSMAEPVSVYFKWCCLGLIPGFFWFFFLPFFGGLPRVNTRVFLFFFPPFFGGLPRVNTGVFFFYPFLASSLCRQVCSSIHIFDSANYTRNWWFWIFQIHRTDRYVIPPTTLFPTLVNTRVFFLGGI